MGIEIQVYDKEDMRYIENDHEALLNAAGFDARLRVDGISIDQEGRLVVLNNCGNFNWLDPDRYEAILRFIQ